jgi:RND family efflux transporter MFP subunit
MSAKSTKASTARIWIGGILLLIVAVTAVLLILNKNKHIAAKETNQLQQEEEKGPVVQAVKIGMSKPGQDMTFTGEARPFESVTLYAKTSGYMDKILVDKGDKVHQGQLLATIVSPEIDQAYRSAIADLDNKTKILNRDLQLVKKDYIAQQEVDQAQTEVDMARATVKSLSEQQQYKYIKAPFDGVVTARFADPGALVQNATNSQTSAQPIVTVSRTNQIRIYIYVEQSDAFYLKNGYPVTIGLTERPDFKMNATITRISGELDPKTRMMLVEIDIPNKDNAIIAGSYVQVHIKAPANPHLQIPAEALVIRNNKYFVGLITNDSKLHYQPVQVGETDGQKIAVISGLQNGDTVALNVGYSLFEGQKVRPQIQ